MSKRIVVPHGELTGDIVPPARMTDRADSTTSWKVVDGLRRRYFISISNFSLLPLLENMMRPSIALSINTWLRIIYVLDYLLLRRWDPAWILPPLAVAGVSLMQSLTQLICKWDLLRMVRRPRLPCCPSANATSAYPEIFREIWNRVTTRSGTGIKDKYLVLLEVGPNLQQVDSVDLLAQPLHVIRYAHYFRSSLLLPLFSSSPVFCHFWHRIEIGDEPPELKAVYHTEASTEFVVIGFHLP